ncbi:MAG: pyridoxal-phosphate dependent enzyme [Polyangiales bacterium]
MPLGTYPTPVARLLEVERMFGAAPGVELWCKHDDLTSPLYGGNKVRKLEHLLLEAQAKNARRIVTIGAVGSHHVLATALYGKRAGFEVEAVLAPQPWTPHVEEVVRIGASLGFTAFPVSSYAGVPFALARRLREGDRGIPYFVPPGGSSVTGSLGYVEAATELAEQIARGELPRPRTVVVALGSGGTVAGLLVGFLRAGLLTPSSSQPALELLAAQVVDPPLASAPATLALALALCRRLGERLGRATIATLSRALRVVRSQLGSGYGHATDAGNRATAFALADGLTLDATYTAKAFAAALDEVRARGAAPAPPRTGSSSGSRPPPAGPVLYWHTLAAPGPFSTLLAEAPPLSSVPEKVRALMRPPSAPASPPEA